MRLWIHAIALAMAIWPCAATCQAKQSLTRQVDAYVEPLVRTGNFSGVVLIARGERPLVRKAYGLASAELGVAHTPASRFQIASVSKPITAAAILRLADQGRIDLKAPLSRVLPDFPNAERLTIHDLLTHTSGIPDINLLPGYDDLSLKRHTVAELVAAFRDKPLAFQPGAAFAYSNSNYVLLAQIIEKVSGESYGAFLKRELFDPLGMTATGHRGDSQAITTSLVEGYDPVGRTGLRRAPWLDWTVKTGNGSIYASADDLLRFTRGFFGGKVVSPAMQAAAIASYKANFGYGWMSDRHLDRTRHYFLGRSPGYTAAISYYPEADLTVVVLSNVFSSASSAAADGVAAIALGQPGPPSDASDAALPADLRARLVGDYRFGPDFRAPNMRLRIYEEDGRLSMRAPEVPPFPVSPLLRQGDLSFVDRAYWGSVTFEPGPDGKAAGLRFTAGGFSWRAVREP